jgi:uncharacterized protein (DUF1800 family)
MAAHLLNRAGFSGPPSEIEKLAAMGLQSAVDHLVEYERVTDNASALDWAEPGPDRVRKFQEFRQAAPEQKKEMRREQQRTQREHILELRQWWLQRMASGVRPLQEKLTLFWHGHFATSAQKVKNAYMMWLQNETFRHNASGNWLELLTAISKDPAMLIWLDQAQSRKEHPNENFAREVMELFTLGEGHYTEKDILESARALTGWSLDRPREEFIYRPNLHDKGQKTIFGKTGNFDGNDVLKLILEKPEASRFITRKLWVFFAAENPADNLVDALATEFHANGMNFKPLLKKIFLSEAFYSEEVVRQQVKSPVQWLVSSARILERDLPPPMVSTNALRMLGQDLLLPPNVKGWDGGLSWITTNNLLNRYNFASFLVFGRNPIQGMALRANAAKAKPKPGFARFARNNRPGSPINAAKLFPEEMRKDKERFLAELEKRLLQARLRPNHRDALREYVDGRGEIDDDDVLHAINVVMSTPEFQLD